MSATCAPASLDDPTIEDIPRPDEEGEEGEEGDEEEGEEEPPFTEEEIDQMMDEIKELASQEYTSEDGYEKFLNDLDSELKEAKDLQDRGHILLDVLEYLQNPEDGEDDEEDDEEGVGRGQGGPSGVADDDEEGEEEGEEGLPEYPGEEGLQNLWQEIQEFCSEDDIARLETELEGKPPEEQWNVLVEVYDYLSEEQEKEAEEFEAWQPTPKELEAEWKELMKQVPKEDLPEVQKDWKKAGGAEKKQMLWDVRKLLLQNEEEDEPPSQKAPPKAPPPPKGGYKDETRSEVRQRGKGGRGNPSDLEYDFEKAPDGGDWHDYYDKESSKDRRSKGGRNWVLVGGAFAGMGILTLLLVATMAAEEDQSIMQSAMGLFGMSS
tara:strand:+ start:362 stop:1495 length:1134 start_codon:yes stop_codon:yes gene_type:complete